MSKDGHCLQQGTLKDQLLRVFAEAIQNLNGVSSISARNATGRATSRSDIDMVTMWNKRPATV